MRRPCAQLAKKISPSMDIGPLSAPYTLVPLLAMAQLVSVARPGQEPDVSQPFAEDMRAFDGSLAEPDGARATPALRRGCACSWGAAEAWRMRQAGPGCCPEEMRRKRLLPCSAGPGNARPCQSQAG